jgi:predicted ester cyclase
MPWAAVAAAVGGLLGFAGVLSVLLPPQNPYGLAYQPGALGDYLHDWGDFASYTLTTLSLGGVLALVGGARSRAGITAGLVALASLIALLWFFVYVAFVFDPVLTPWPGPPPLLVILGYTAFCGKSAALFVVGFTALRAEVVGRWGLLLLALGALEAALLVVLTFAPSWPFSDAWWLWMLFGLPESGVGLTETVGWIRLTETVGWILLGCVLLRLEPGCRRRKLEEERRALEEENLRETRLLYEEAFGAGNLSMVDEIVADDFFDHLHHRRGPQAFKSSITSLRDRFPDLVLCVRNQIADGEQITTRCVLSGTDVGGVLWYPPTHKHVTFRVAYVDHFRGGKLIEHWEKADMRNLLEQLGLPAGNG